MALESPAVRRYVLAMDEVPRHEVIAPQGSAAEPAPPQTAPHLAVAAGLLDVGHVLMRADDDTDEDYAARSRLFAAAIAFARAD